jgi:hypothetical protein
MLTGLKSTLIELREALTDESLVYAKKIAKELEITTSVPEKRGMKRNIHHPGEESSVLSAEDYFRIQLKEIVDVLAADLSRRNEVLQETSINFEFYSDTAFISMKST